MGRCPSCRGGRRKLERLKHCRHAGPRRPFANPKPKMRLSFPGLAQGLREGVSVLSPDARQQTSRARTKECPGEFPRPIPCQAKGVCKTLPFPIQDQAKTTMLMAKRSLRHCKVLATYHKTSLKHNLLTTRPTGMNYSKAATW